MEKGKKNRYDRKNEEKLQLYKCRLIVVFFRTICSRASNSTACNSHTIFTIRFTQVGCTVYCKNLYFTVFIVKAAGSDLFLSVLQASLQNNMPSEKISVLHLVDLAGSKSIHDEVDHTCIVQIVGIISRLPPPPIPLPSPFPYPLSPSSLLPSPPPPSIVVPSQSLMHLFIISFPTFSQGQSFPSWSSLCPFFPVPFPIVSHLLSLQFSVLIRLLHVLLQCNNVSGGADFPDDRSLMMLERVISTLASKASLPDSKAIVPYKDSVSYSFFKLLQMLSNNSVFFSFVVVVVVIMFYLLAWLF